MANRIGIAPPAKHEYTEAELKKLIEAAEDPGVQAIVHNLAVNVFHTVSENKAPAVKIPPPVKKRHSSRKTSSNGG